jgi:putative ATP-dependent endonuclease of OLD family
MRLEKLRIKGFRNFNDTEIVFQEKSLIIGANDVGKTNLLYASQSFQVFDSKPSLVM